MDNGLNHGIVTQTEILIMQKIRQVTIPVDSIVIFFAAPLKPEMTFWLPEKHAIWA